MRGCSSNLHRFVLFTIFGLFVGGASVSGLRICSYNVKRFNSEKAAKYAVLHTLTRIVSRCDVCLLQDVVDSDGKAIERLVSSLNRYDQHRYEAVASGALGKASDLQKYVFIYKTPLVNVTAQHQTAGSAFLRPPFVVQFYSKKTDIKEFILVPLHSDPDDAVREIDGLYDVFQEVSAMWNNQNVMFLGDFHAGCAYVTRNDRKNIRLFTNTNFTWLIGDREDTTVTEQTDCAYDRIVVYGEPFLMATRPQSGRVFNFGKEFKINRNMVLAVSDHFPVEVRLKGSAFFLQATPLLILLGVSAVI
ncbi:deoxyribonuclease gamma-like isoform X2 [Cyprinodon tularosa]|uniref:deoxyribonuclease gamma-like isoform X2 n=1 Tax=Cyprinodon tularosa TaxID=77115 RepID=UPI0018E2019F|nr:deoxyribonuclease gamma-like isoform X2 [Cyprinodon tularosa]